MSECLACGSVWVYVYLVYLVYLVEVSIATALI